LKEEDIADAIERRVCREDKQTQKRGKRGEERPSQEEKSDTLAQIKTLLVEMNCRLEKIEKQLAK
jgi:hypothetical protein